MYKANDVDNHRGFLPETLAASTLIFILASSPGTGVAQTPEDQLRSCVKSGLKKYTPVSPYSVTFSCSVGNKTDPFGSPPQDGPRAVSYSVPQHIFLTAAAIPKSKISEGDHTQPFINPRQDVVSSTIWCRAEDKLFGAGGAYVFDIRGDKQRAPTTLEYRAVLQECTNSLATKLLNDRGVK